MSFIRFGFIRFKDAKSAFFANSIRSLPIRRETFRAFILNNFGHTLPPPSFLTTNYSPLLLYLSSTSKTHLTRLQYYTGKQTCKRYNEDIFRKGHIPEGRPTSKSNSKSKNKSATSYHKKEKQFQPSIRNITEPPKFYDTRKNINNQRETKYTILYNKRHPPPPLDSLDHQLQMFANPFEMGFKFYTEFSTGKWPELKEHQEKILEN